VNGQALDDGEEVKQIMGSNAYSSRVATISSAFIQSNSQAAAVAQLYLTWLSQVREEFTRTVDEPAGKLIHILDLVDFGGGIGVPDYQVLRVESNLKERMQKLLVAEVL
jgi:hypothetical protein